MIMIMGPLMVTIAMKVVPMRMTMIDNTIGLFYSMPMPMSMVMLMLMSIPMTILLVPFPELRSIPIPMVMYGPCYYPSDCSIIMIR